MVRYYIEINLNMGMEPVCCISLLYIEYCGWIHLNFLHIGQFGEKKFHDFLADAIWIWNWSLADLKIKKIFFSGYIMDLIVIINAKPNTLTQYI